jgi:5,10-methylenetetrahydromethanopterin reductase
VEFGCFFNSSASSWKFARRAEELGYTNAWFYDTPMLNAELFASMGAAAVNTSRIRLGTGVLIPSNRIDPVAAAGLATLNAMAPGRIDFGIGTGFTSRQTLGQSALPMARMEEYIRVVRALLRGELVEWTAEGSPHKIKFLNPEIGLINIEDEIPLYISAFGPKMRQLVAKLGANVICTAEDVAGLTAMHKAWTEAGRDLTQLRTVMIAGGAVVREGEPFDSLRVKAQAGPLAAMVFHNELEKESMAHGGSSGGAAPGGFPPQFMPQLEAYRLMYANYEPKDARYLTNHRGHLLFLKAEEEPHITADAIQTLSFSGTKPELVNRVRQLRDRGLTQLGVETRHGHEIAMLEDWADVFASV